MKFHYYYSKNIKGQVLKTKISRTLGKIVTLSLIISTMTVASNKNRLITIEHMIHTTTDKSYQYMSIEQLQKEVEKHSLCGNLSFAMGMELIKRLTKK